jgi:hypothetical protein
MRRRTAVIGIAGLAAVAALYSAFWWFAAGRFAMVVDDWAAERRRAGWQVDYRLGSVRGFPLALEGRIDTPRLAGPGSPPAWTWQPPPIEAATRPWRVREIAFASPGRHRIVVASGGAQHHIDLAAATARGRMRSSGGAWPEVSLDLAEVTATTPLLPEPIAVKSIAAQLAPRPVANRPETSGEAPRLTFAAAHIMLPEGPRPVLGHLVERLEVDAVFIGRLRGAPLGEALAAWRDGGGTVELERLRLQWGPLDLEGSGTFTLDGEMRPLASGNIRIQGYGETIQELAKAGIIRSREAIAAQLTMGLLSRPGRAGRGEFLAPITIQYGWLSVGPARLLPVPPLRLD